MTLEQLQIAVSNTGDPSAKSMLSDIAPLFERVCNLNESFPDRINANKASRGEAPTKISKRKREELVEYEKDAAGLDRTLANDYRTLEGPSIVHAMSYALETDLQFWRGAMLKHAHPADRPIVEEVLEAKTQLQANLKQFLERFPPSDNDT